MRYKWRSRNDDDDCVKIARRPYPSRRYRLDSQSYFPTVDYGPLVRSCQGVADGVNKSSVSLQSGYTLGTYIFLVYVITRVFF